jgi:hypothetical protein
MRPSYDDFDDFDFADSLAVSRLLRDQQREERRLARRRFAGPGDEDSYEDYGSYDEYDEFDDYDDDEFDAYAGLDIDD